MKDLIHQKALFNRGNGILTLDIHVKGFKIAIHG